jgi:hypothetical protein
VLARGTSERMTYNITTQIAPLIPPGTRTSHINRAFNAALGDFLALDDGVRYAALYEKYMGIAPRFRPTGGDCDRWSDVDERDDAMQRMFARHAIRFGYSAGAPYVYRENGDLTGFDFELAEALTAIIGAHYSRPLTAKWEEVTLSGDDQADKLTALYNGLVAGTFDLALSGQMMLPDAYLSGLPIEWTAPTAMLFTAISWTGRDRTKLDVHKLASLHSSDLSAFEAYAAAETKRLALEFRIFSVVNPGPSPKAAQDLVLAINRAKGRAVWDAGDVSDSDTVMFDATDHFAVGDSLASGAQSMKPGFSGIYLNIPATNELWPIAGFTAATKAASAQPEIAVYAEHSDSKKPMTIDPSLPEQQSGWNIRVFNRTEVRRATSIHLEHDTGIVTLGPGLYHITGMSAVTYDDLASPGKVTTDCEPFAGYCRLRYADKPACTNEEAIAIGTMSTANMLPSTFETWLEVKDHARIVLEHQVGANVEHIYLQGIWANSSWHVFARIAIQKI